MEARASSPSTKAILDDSYRLLIESVDRCEEEKKIDKALEYFFRVHEDREAPSIKDRDTKYSLLKQIIVETINRDFIMYVKTGTWGELALLL